MISRLQAQVGKGFKNKFTEIFLSAKSEKSLAKAFYKEYQSELAKQESPQGKCEISLMVRGQ